MACEWYFDRLNQKNSRQGDIPTKHAFDADVETFVREVLQNANDAGPVDEGEPVRVTFRFRQLTAGDGLEEFNSAFRWDEQFRKHLEGAATEEQDLSIRQFLENDTDELILLTIEDENTEGLSGAEDADESNYTALVRDMHRSNKDDTQGGSHGVGGTVLWAFSGVSTVLFTSTPEEPEGGTPPRFVGRSYLPDHTVDGDLYRGYGWFGRPDADDPGGRHVSVWGDEAEEVARDLSAARPPESGTSLTVVGFREPGERQPTGEGLEEVVQRIQRAAVENFWPAIRRQQLEVFVQSPTDPSPRPADFGTVESVGPFLEAYEDLYDPDGQLGKPGGTESETFEFDFPSRDDGTETPDEAEVSLGARTAGPSEEKRRNEVAVFRGAGMVVQYISMDDVARRGADFHAVLACGRARTELGEEHDAVDDHVENLLRAAEPAAHNEWTGTPRLKNRYTGRRVGVVQDLQGGQLRDELRELIAGDDDESGERLENFETLFPGSSTEGGEGGETPTPTPPGDSHIERELHDLVFDGDHWEFELTLESDGEEDESWAARVWLTQMFESGGDGERLEIDGVDPVGDAEEVDYYRESDGAVVVKRESPGSVTLRCDSIVTGPPDPTSGRTARTGVRHSAVDGGSS